MIYSLRPSMFPTPEQTLAEFECEDLNGQTWFVVDTALDVYLTYKGDPEFQESSFLIELDGRNFLIANTNCLMIRGAHEDFTPALIKHIKSCFTDNIWVSLTDLFRDRLLKDPQLLTSEITD